MSKPRFQGDNAVSAAPLGKPLHFEFSGQTAPNRFLKAAMTERQASWSPDELAQRGIPSPELIETYRRWGKGGYGLILTGNIMIDAENLEAAGNTIVPRQAPFNGQRFEAFQQLAQASKTEGALAVAQISHPGRQVADDLVKQPISASDIQLEGEQLGSTFGKPRAASLDDIQGLVQGFAHAAEFLYKAGFDGAELHGAHGYLLSQFLSPTTNHRTDHYGGSLENRTRIITDIAAAIRQRVPASFTLGIKVNSVEFQDKGFSTDECKNLCQMLEEHRFDFVELSGGTYQNLAFAHRRESTRKREAFFLDFADVVVAGLTKTRTYVTGGLRSVEAMVHALDTVDGIGLARPAAIEFDLPKQILHGGVPGSIKWKLDEDDFGITNFASGTLMKQNGRRETPLDLTRDENVEIFKKALQAWQEKMQNDQSKSTYGYADLSGHIQAVEGSS